jgi:hypothetical protein
VIGKTGVGGAIVAVEMAVQYSEEVQWRMAGNMRSKGALCAAWGWASMR